MAMIFFLHPGCISKQQEAWRYDPQGRFILIVRSSREKTRDALAPGFTGPRRHVKVVLFLHQPASQSKSTFASHAQA